MTIALCLFPGEQTRSVAIGHSCLAVRAFTDLEGSAMSHDELLRALLLERYTHPTPEYHNPPRPEGRLQLDASAAAADPAAAGPRPALATA